MNNEGYGLVLGGGGAKGAYEIGVYKALKEMEIPIDVVVGTSVGALNAAIIVQDDFELAVDLWQDLKMSRIISFEEAMEHNKTRRSTMTSIIHTIRRSLLEGGMDVTPLKELLASVIDEDKIRQAETDLGIVTFSLSDFKPVRIFKKDIPEGKLVDYLLASSCFPTFKPHIIDDKRFIDGGVYDNIPISLVLERCSKLITVDVSGPGRTRRADTSNHEVINIKNSEYLGRTLQFDGEISKINIDYGYYDTLRAFDKLSGKRYYFEQSEETGTGLYEQNLSDEEFDNFYAYFGTTINFPKASKYELIRNKLLKLVKNYITSELSRPSVFIALLEICAETLKIDRRKIYSQNDLIDAILLGYDEYMAKNEKKSRSLKKSIVFGNCSFDTQKQEVFTKRMTVAMTQPKLALSNIFVALLLSRQKSIE